MHVGLEAKDLPWIAWLLWICSSPWCSLAEQEIDVYFGAGGFWHVQKVVNQAEEDLLGRSWGNITGIAGYAGGKHNSGDVCHNTRGHAQVVAVRVPLDRLADLARRVWSSLFVDGERSDRAHRGAKYRAVVGFRGGVAGSPEILATIDEAQGELKVAELEAGVGNDADSLGTRRVYVYDSTDFPFHQAQLSDQFHDYGGHYKQQLLDSGRLREVDCPFGFISTLLSPGTIVVVSIVVIFCCWCCLSLRMSLRSNADIYSAPDSKPASEAKASSQQA
mmetsp:Transcript_17713/g.44859  ORF Transcript_17713/g.44859 Transcript_17713/m.44859 type:complete len:276 (+) Transcript_17713:91-918(+)